MSQESNVVTQTREFFFKFFAKIRCLHCGDRFEEHVYVENSRRKCIYDSTEFHPNFENAGYESHDDIHDDIKIILNEE